MLDQLVIARSYIGIDHVDLVRAGEVNCGRRGLFARLFGTAARARRYGLSWFRSRPAGA